MLPSQKGLWARASARSERRTKRPLLLAGWRTLVCSFPDHAADRREACSHLPGMRKRSVRGLPAADRLRSCPLGSNLARPACRINHEGHGDTGCRANKQVPQGRDQVAKVQLFVRNTYTQFWKTLAITSSHFVPTYCKRCSVPFNVEGNEAENDAVCP